MSLSVRTIARTTVAGVILAAGAACSSSGGSGQPSPNPSQAANQLQSLATAGTQQSYTAIYNVQATQPAGSAVVSVGHTPTAYRLNITRGTSVSVLVHNAQGTYSCQATPRRPVTCLIVAKPGSPVPPLFDAGQKLWSDYLTELSTNISAYLVTPAGTTPATATLPVGSCFAVAPMASPAPATSVAQGTYCLTEDGIPTKATFTSGTFTLTRIAPAPPTYGLRPLAHPTPIPGLK